MDDKEKKGPIEEMGASLDKIMNESPTLMKMLNEVSKKYDELQSKYNELKDSYDKLYNSFKYDEGYIAGMEDILEKLGECK